MSLHYLVKLEMLIGHMLYHWVVTERNSRIYPTSTVASKFARFESSWLQCVMTIARGVQNTYHWSGRTETATENRVGQLSLQLGYVVTAEAIRPSGVVDSSRAVMCVLYTFSCNISHMLLSTGFKSGEFGGHSLGGINSGVSFCNNSTVACAQ